MSNGFSDREAGQVSQNLETIQSEIEDINSKLDEFLDEDYTKTRKKVNTHRTWFKFLWGIVSAIGMAVLSMVTWLFRSIF